MTLYELLINNISKSIKLSLNEMAKKIDHRTIDRKLWLSVASVCSRNKATESEFVKPMLKLNKEDLLNRYIAGLLIMKKPCPKSIRDIESLKTLKLFALKALELGATLLDILDLYSINSGSLSPNTNKSVTTLAPSVPVKPVVTLKPVTTYTPRVRKPLSERVLKFKTEQELKLFLLKHVSGCNTNMTKMDKFLTDADAVILAYKLTYSNGYYSGFPFDPFSYNDDESLRFIPTGESYELYGDNYYGERYQKAKQPEIVYHYLTNGRNGNNVLLRTQSLKTIKRLLSKITSNIINKFINAIVEESMKKRNSMIRNGEIKVRGIKFDLSIYGFDRIPSSYTLWAKKYINSYLKQYQSININYSTYTGKVTSLSYYRGESYVDLYILNYDTDIDDSDKLSNLFTNNYRFFRRGDDRNGNFVCNLDRDDIELIFKIAYDNAKATYIKYKGK